MPELGRRHRLLVLVICCSSLFVVSMDSTIVNLALPSIQADLSASVTSLQWTIDAYTLTLASLLMLAGSTADRVGRKRIFRIGLVLFGVGSLLCSVAPSAGALVGFRVVQALGGAMLNPVAMSIIVNVFTDPRERARAIGAWGSVVGLSMALGPLIGGALVDAVGWRSVFWINVPVVVAAVVATTRFVPESRAPRPRRLDPVGQVLMAVLLGGATFAIIEGPAQGWTSPAVLGCAVAAAAALATLLPWERNRPEPLLDPRFFRSVPFAGATVIAVCAFASLAGFLFVNALYLQSARGYSPLHAGLLTLPMAAMAAVLPTVAGRLVATRGARIPLVVGGAGLVLSGAVLLTLRTDSPLWVLITAYVLFGIAFGMVNPPITNTAVSGMPAAQAGVASAVASTSRQVGTALGVAIIGSAVTASVVGPLPTGLAAATHVGWAVQIGCGIVVLVLGLVSTTAWARRTATHTAELFAASDVPARAGVS
ncbi:MFS transporter [Pseudonocardia kujensis]|uniref:MFS transporter n=1 Tax=Pseudonocardia kujensis TaxID=1128675 RepID=UPI001E523B4C|nr:MFS transporter [Pseudonocardia kujensis]MCE0763007.1 MFS transporter [Pseudonocardia kujensis]